MAPAPARQACSIDFFFVSRLREIQIFFVLFSTMASNDWFNRKFSTFPLKLRTSASRNAHTIELDPAIVTLHSGWFAKVLDPKSLFYNKAPELLVKDFDATEILLYSLYDTAPMNACKVEANPFIMLELCHELELHNPCIARVINYMMVRLGKEDDAIIENIFGEYLEKIAIIYAATSPKAIADELLPDASPVQIAIKKSLLPHIYRLGSMSKDRDASAVEKKIYARLDIIPSLFRAHFLVFVFNELPYARFDAFRTFIDDVATIRDPESLDVYKSETSKMRVVGEPAKPRMIKGWVKGLRSIAVPPLGPAASRLLRDRLLFTALRLANASALDERCKRKRFVMSDDDSDDELTASDEDPLATCSETDE